MKKNLLKILAILIIMNGLVIGVYLVGRVQEIRRSASLGDNLQVVFNPISGSYDKDSLEVLIGLVKPSGKVLLSYDIFLDITGISLPIEDDALRQIFKVPDFEANILDIRKTSSGVRIIGAVFPYADNSIAVPLVKLNLLNIQPGSDISVKVAPGSRVAACVAGGNQVCTDGSLELFSLTLMTATYTRPLPTSTPRPTATATPVPTSTPRPTATATPLDPVVTFYLRFDNVTRQIPDQVVRVRLIKDSNIYDFADITVTSDDKGILTGKFVASKVPVGSGYRMSIKGPKHLAMRFCEDGQSSYCFGPGNLTLNTGENNYFDFSNLPLLAGDITGQSSAGVQDGVVDMTDMVLIKSALATGASESVINLADLNYDGGVSGMDMQLFLKTLSERYDDSF